MKWRHGSDNNPFGHGRGRGVVVGANCVMWEWGCVCWRCDLFSLFCCVHSVCFIFTSAHYITLAYSLFLSLSYCT